AVVMGSVSKYFSMTGWRIGWMLLPEYLRAPVDRLIGNLTICPPADAQFAAIAAFTPESAAELDAHVERYARNRELVQRWPGARRSSTGRGWRSRRESTSTPRTAPTPCG